MLGLALTFAVATVLPASFTEPVNPAPYSATYSVGYRSLDAGRIQFSLRSEGAGKYVYESHADPSFLARFVVSERAVERSVMLIDSDGVRPLSWITEDGKSGEKRDGALEFAWDAHIVRGTVEGKSVEFPTEPGLQDRLSIQVAVMTALQRGEDPGTIPMIGDKRVKQYSYTRIGTERIRTEAGEFETVVYESTRPGSDRLSRVWHAPALGYLPVRAEQIRKGKLETVVQLVKVARG